MRKIFIVFIGFFLSFNILARFVLAENSNLNVSATVPQAVSNADLTLSSSPASTTILKENDEITITVHYRSQESSTWPFEVVGSWDQGQIEENASNMIDIFNYVVDSATSADDGTVPVVDTINRKITWEIPALSSSTNYHTVSFKLHVRPDSPTEKSISAQVHADCKISTTPLTQQTLTFTIQKTSAQPGPTAKPIPISPTTPPGQPQSIEKPGQGLRFSLVTIDEVTDTTAQIIFVTTDKTSYSLFYDSSVKNLTSQIASPLLESSHTLSLSDLSPGTSYFFKIVARDQTGATITSDIFTFRTAKTSETVEINQKDILISWEDFLLTSPTINKIVLPIKQPLTVQLRINNPQKIQSIKARFKNAQVLGLNTFATSTLNIEETPLIETLPGVFSGEVQTPNQPGKYKLLLEIHDIAGGFSNRSVPYEIYVSSPLTVLDKKTGAAVENAQASILKFEDKDGSYVLLNKSFSLPTKTDEYGQMYLALPPGRYIIKIDATLYHPKEIKIEVGISSFTYPTIKLEPDFTLGAFIKNFKESIFNTLFYLNTVLSPLFVSHQSENMIYAFTGIVSLILFLAILWEKETIKQLRVVRRAFLSYLVTLIFLSLINAVITVCFIMSLILLYNLKVVSPLIFTSVAFGLFINFLKIYWLSSRPSSLPKKE